MLTPARLVLGGLAVSVFVRYLITPTWPCAVVTLGVFALAVGGFVLADKSKARDMERVAEQAKAAGEAAAAVSDRVDRIERARAFGG